MEAVHKHASVKSNAVSFIVLICSLLLMQFFYILLLISQMEFPQDDSVP